MRLPKKILISLAALLAVLVGSIPFAAKTLLTKERLVSELQKALNCKVEVGQFDVSLLSFPARVDARQLSLTPNDPEARNTSVTVDLLTIQISLVDLVFRKIDVHQILISGVSVRDEIGKDGRSPLSEMFGHPSETHFIATTDDTPPPPPVAEPAAPSLTQPASEPTTAPLPADGSDEPSQAKSPAFTLREALLENATIHIVDRRAFTKTDIENLRIRIFNTDIDPSDLAHHNSCNLELSGHAKVQGRKKVGDKGVDVQVADILFLGTGTAVPFDAATGLPNPEALVSLSVKKGSTLGGHLTFGEASGKNDGLDKLKDYLGIDFSDLPLGGVLQNDLSAEVKLAGKRLEWQQDTRLEFPDYTFVMRKGSWTDSEIQDSRQELSVVPARPISDKMVAGITTKYGDGISKAVMKTFGTKEGGLQFDVILTGPPNKPKPTIPPDTLNRAIQALGGDLLKGLLGK